MACVELPKDAEGREIPLDTKCLYLVRGGLKQNVERFTYELKDAEWSVETNIAIYDTEDFSLTQPGRPDSWEKLEEDLDRCIKADSLCAYSPSKECSACVLPRDSQCHCDSFALKAIKERIRKLRGEGE
nr:MAG TPA: hypothetical protein [Caudoviricetes sp.]